MPNVKLPTGVDLYYESHGQGEPLIFVPSTAYSGEVWKPSQMPLAQSSEYRLSRSSRLRPLRCRLKTSTPSSRWLPTSSRLMDHLKIPSAHLHRSLHGRADRAVLDAKLSGTSKELDYGGQRLRPRGTGRLGLHHRFAAPPRRRYG